MPDDHRTDPRQRRRGGASGPPRGRNPLGHPHRHPCLAAPAGCRARPAVALRPPGRLRPAPRRRRPGACGNRRMGTASALPRSPARQPGAQATSRPVAPRLLPQAASPSGRWPTAGRPAAGGKPAAGRKPPGVADDERRPGLRRRRRRADAGGHPWVDPPPRPVRRTPGRRTGERQRGTLRAPGHLLPARGLAARLRVQRSPARALLRRGEEADLHLGQRPQPSGRPGRGAGDVPAGLVAGALAPGQAGTAAGAGCAARAALRRRAPAHRSLPRWPAPAWRGRWRISRR